MKKIKLTRGLVALVDDSDYEQLNAHKWYAQAHGRTSYAHRTLGKKLISMHRVIMNPPVGMVIDHKDCNGLNNQRANLRICTRLENARNRPKYKSNKSGYKGVCWNTKDKRWIAKIKLNNKIIHLGSFLSPLEASKAYIVACKKLHGEFANIN